MRILAPHNIQNCIHTCQHSVVNRNKQHTVTSCGSTQTGHAQFHQVLHCSWYDVNSWRVCGIWCCELCFFASYIFTDSTHGFLSRSKRQWTPHTRWDTFSLTGLLSKSFSLIVGTQWNKEAGSRKIVSWLSAWTMHLKWNAVLQTLTSKPLHHLSTRIKSWPEDRHLICTNPQNDESLLIG